MQERAENNTEINFLKVQVPEELAQHVMLERSYCGKHIKNRNNSSSKYYNRYKNKSDRGNFTHHLTRTIGFYLLLKAESGESGWIKDYTKQVHSLAKKFNISSRSFFTYIKQLESMKLAFRDQGKIRIVGWDQLGKILDIDTKIKHNINFYNDGKQKIHWWFAAIEIEVNQDSQAYMIRKKMNKHSEVKNSVLSALIKRGYDVTRDDNLRYFAGRLFMLYLEDFVSGTEVHDILVEIRADLNRSVKKIAEAWKMSPQLASYWKKQMSKEKVIAVSKLKVESQWSSATKECHKRKGCHVLWDDKKKERVWFLCDQITIIKPGEWKEFLALQQAA